MLFSILNSPSRKHSITFPNAPLDCAHCVCRFKYWTDLSCCSNKACPDRSNTNPKSEPHLEPSPTCNALATSHAHHLNMKRCRFGGDVCVCQTLVRPAYRPVGSASPHHHHHHQQQQQQRVESSATNYLIQTSCPTDRSMHPRTNGI